MKKKHSLKSHPFVQTLKSTVDPYFAEEIRQVLLKAKSTNAPTPWLNSRRRIRKVEPYQVNVSRATGQMEAVVKNLKLSLFLIRRYPTIELSSDNALSHMQWIDYHYSSFITSYASAYETALQLTNYVFELGIPETKCRNDVVRDNSHVKGTGVYAALKQLEALVASYRPSRHAFIHRGEQTPIEEIFRNSMDRFIRVQTNPKIKPGPLNQIFSRRLVGKVCKRLNADVRSLELALCQLLDSSFLIYQSRVK